MGGCNSLVSLAPSAGRRALTVSRTSETFDKVRFTVYASFDLEPMMGHGEALFTSERGADELVGGTYCK